MSLPWFPFNIKDFLANTKRLNTEAKGAYLLLMLDYYEQEKGPPDDDDVLAAICELSPEAWHRHRKVLAPLFEIKDGIWTHDRIDDEVRNGHRRHAQTVAATEAARIAREAKKTGQRSVEQPLRTPQRTPRRRPLNVTDNVTSTVTESVTDNVTSLQTQTHTTLNSSSKSDDDAKANSGSLGSPIPRDWQPNDILVERCHTDGATDDDIDQQVRVFVAYNIDRGTWSPAWDATWALWWERHLERKRKAEKPKAPPRVEVNSGPFVPGESDWDKAIAKWSTNESLWPRWAGNAPGSTSCKCPPEILRKHGIDPTTGAKLREAAE